MNRKKLVVRRFVTLFLVVMEASTLADKYEV